MRTVTKTFDIYRFDELPEDAQQKAVDNLADINVSHEWWDMDGLLDLSNQEAKDAGILDEYLESKQMLIAYDLKAFSVEDRYIQFENVSIRNLDLFRRWLGIPEELWEGCAYAFMSPQHWKRSTIFEIVEDFEDGRSFTEAEQEVIDAAIDKMHEKFAEALSSLSKEYDYQISYEAIVETIKANGYWFTEDGKIYRDRQSCIKSDCGSGTVPNAGGN